MKQVKSVWYYLLHNVHDKTYRRVWKAALKHPYASLYELQHGVGSKASISYRTRHVPEIEKEYEYIPEYIPEYIEKEELKIFCYRDYLGGARGAYYGVNLYFVEKRERGFFEDVREHFADELTTAMMAVDYDRNPLSSCDADDIKSTDKIAEYDFIFEISNIQKNTFQYWGHWHNNRWIVFEMFGDFDDTELNRILRTR